ncbi:hypothetical protein [Gemmatimonas sp.]|uniref:hypothetical protein n=1 Tax=Gemmatimonas sp. TaxID=1962908 RepID=UPI003983A80A
MLLDNEEDTYVPAYDLTSTGRIAEIGGGVQGCSRVMKNAALGAVPDLRNYDLSNAQARALLQELDGSGVDVRWLRRYVTDPAIREGVAMDAGVSIGTLKSSFYAVLMGGTFAPVEGAAIMGYVAGEVGRARAPEVLAALAGELRELQRIVDDWLVVLRSASIQTERAPRGRIRNRCGMSRPIPARDDAAAWRELRAFVLQGWEKNYVFNLMKLGKRHGFVPVSDQHDGLVVLGSIPHAAHVEAVARSGFTLAKLADKPFATEKDRERYFADRPMPEANEDERGS